MKKSIKITLALLGLASMVLASCNTMAGAGQDLQKAGAAITHKAER